MSPAPHHPASVPTVVVCGSLAHPDRITAAVAAEHAAGRQVIAWPVLDASIPEAEHAAAWRQHIERCDEVVVIPKPNGMIGASTAAERDYAVHLGRTVRTWQPESVIKRHSAQNPTLYALIGPPGAGKTTLRAAFSAAAVVCLDDARAQASCCAANQDPDLAQLVVAMGRRQARAMLDSGRDVLWDATNAVDEHRRELTMLADEHGARAVAVLVLTPLAVVLQRNGLRDPTPCPSCGYRRRVPEDAVRRMHRAIVDDLHGLRGEGWDEIWTASRLEEDAW